MDNLTPTDAERALPPHPSLRAGERVAVQCADCHRLIPSETAILYRFDSTYHCADGADCAAAMKDREREAGR